MNYPNFGIRDAQTSEDFVILSPQYISFVTTVSRNTARTVSFDHPLGFRAEQQSKAKQSSSDHIQVFGYFILILDSEMESSCEMVAFPLLTTPIESNYRACTIPYRFPSDNPKKPTPTELSWIDLFSNATPSFRYYSLLFSSPLPHSQFHLFFLHSYC